MRAVLCVLISISVAGCATRGPVNVSTTAASLDTALPRPPEDSLETFMSKVRKLSSEARPGQASASLEGRYPALAAAAAARNLRRRLRLPFAPRPRNTVASAFSTRRSSFSPKRWRSIDATRRRTTRSRACGAIRGCLIWASATRSAPSFSTRPLRSCTTRSERFSRRSADARWRVLSSNERCSSTKRPPTL